PAEPDRIPPAGLPKPPAVEPPAADPGRTYPVSRRKFVVPIHLTEAGASGSTVQVQVSRDRGATWTTHGYYKSEGQGLNFEATADGEYWFRVAAISENGVRGPDDRTTGGPDLKVLVDTVPPEVRTTAARRDGAEVAVEWAVADANPGRVRPTVISHRPAGDPNAKWTEVGVPAGRTDARFEPNGAGPVEVRVKVRDAAGNEGVSPTVTVG
ncbi:MAG: hypothetical protein K2X87_34105, partial [Gemmataceae bacterium]|nr:hypothetical protein [Gemmataceae bacterium]